MKGQPASVVDWAHIETGANSTVFTNGMAVPYRKPV